jgi:metal-responsive CopG/Arc/MetJ family transcriptional regulator
MKSIKNIPSRSERIHKAISQKLSENTVKEGVDLESLAKELARRHSES